MNTEKEERIPPVGDGESPPMAAVDAGDQPGQGEEQVDDPAVRLQAELESERLVRQAAEDSALRWRADFENLRRRSLFEAEQARSNLTQELIGRFLPILDDLERALASAAGEAPPSWVTGLDMVYRRFLAVLAEQGLTRLETVGEAFDPQKHEAMLRVEDSGHPSNTVVAELRSGYALGTRVIRPALVKVQV